MGLDERLAGNDSRCCVRVGTRWEGGCEAGKDEEEHEDGKDQGDGVRVRAGSSSASFH